MKPDGGLSSEMDETDVEPFDLFSDLGMLIVENRLPQASKKGRAEGPHCPSRVGEFRRHVCQPGENLCRTYEMVQRQMQMFWKNNIPMCIELLLLPDCEHGQQQARVTDPNFPIANDRCMLLEQWMVHVSTRSRCMENLCSAQSLFQAVKSHLHFSQLSAWLNLSHGLAPQNFTYRISPPGEFCTNTFSQPPEYHTFPLCGLGKSTTIKVTVGTLPRQHGIIHVPCPETSHQPEVTGEDVAGAIGFAGDIGGARSATPPQSSIHPSSMHPSKSWTGKSPSRTPSPPITRPMHFPPQSDDVKKKAPHDCSWSQCQRSMQIASHRQRTSPPSCSEAHQQLKISTPQEEHPTKHPSEFGAIPKRLPHKSPPDYFDHGLSAPELLLSKETKQKSSPKVIMTKKSPGLSYLEQEVPRWATASPTSVLKDSTDSDNSSPDIDKYLHRTLSSKLEPLSPEEMETYLAQFCGASRSRQHEKRLPDMTDLTLAEHKSWHNSPPRRTKSPPITQQPIRHLDFAVSPPRQSKSAKSPTQNKSLSKPESMPSKPHVAESLPEDSTQPSHAESSNGVASKPSSNVEQSEQESECHTENGAAGEHETNGVHFSIGGVEEDESSIAKTPATSVQNGTSVNVPKCESPGLVSDKTVSTPSQSVVPSRWPQGIPPKRAISKSVSDPSTCKLSAHTPANNRASSLLKSVMRKELAQQLEGPITEASIPATATKMTTKTSSVSPPLTRGVKSESRPVPTNEERATFQRTLRNSTSMIFHPTTGLPMQSSPAPVKKAALTSSFDYDCSLKTVRAIKNSLSCANLDKQKTEDGETENAEKKMYSTSAPASTNCLLGNFEESMLNGRLEPLGVVDGFTCEIGASGTFCPKHIVLPVTSFFFSLSDDNAPSPYLGHVNLDSLGKRGYHIPKKGTVQVTLFNPNKTVVKMFVVMYDLSDMPPNCQTFLRQRTLYMPVDYSPSDVPDAPVYLRYLIHIRFASSKSGKIYLHTDIRMIFARDKMEYDSRVANYELRSFTEGPVNPKFSPKR